MNDLVLSLRLDAKVAEARRALGATTDDLKRLSDGLRRAGRDGAATDEDLAELATGLGRVRATMDELTQAETEARGALDAMRASGQGTTAEAQELEAALGRISAELARLSQAETEAAAAQLRHAQGFDDLRASLDPAFAAQRRYEAQVEAVNRAVKIGAVSQADANRVLALAEAQYRATGAAAEVLDQAGRRFDIRGVGMQLSQVVQMAQVTGQPLQALAVQLPDIGLAFGTMGIAAGVAAGVLLPLAGNLFATGEAGGDAEDGVDAFTGALERFRSYADLATTSTLALRGEWGIFAERVRVDARWMGQAAIGEASAGLSGTDLRGGLAPAIAALEEMERRRQFLEAAEAAPQGLRNYQAIETARLNLQGAEEDARAAAEAIGLVPEQVRAMDAAFRAVDAAVASGDLVAMEAALAGVMDQMQAFYAVGAQVPTQLLQAARFVTDALFATRQAILTEGRVVEAQAEETGDAVRGIGGAFAETAEEIARLAAERDRLGSLLPDAASPTEARQIADGIAAIDRRLGELGASAVAAGREVDGVSDGLDALEAALADAPASPGLDAARAQAEAFRDRLKEAKDNADTLNAADLSGLRAGLQALVDLARGLGVEIGTARDAVDDALDSHFDRNQATPTTQDRIREARSVSAAADQGIHALIRYVEGTQGPQGYNTSLENGRFLPGGREQVLTSLTLREIMELQRSMLRHPENHHNSSAIGAGQFVGSTLFGERFLGNRNAGPGLFGELGLSMDDRFTPQLQDRLIDALIQRRLRQVAQGADPLVAFGNEWAGIKAQGVTRSQLDRALGVQTVPDPVTARAEAEAEQRAREADGIRRGLMTPDDRWREEEARAARLRQSGDLDERTYQAELARIERERAEEAQRAASQTAAAQEAEARALQATRDAYEGLVASMDPLEAARQAFAQGQRVLDEALRAGTITTDEYADSHARLLDRLSGEEVAIATANILEGVTAADAALAEAVRANREALSAGISGGVKTFFTDLITGAKSAEDAMKALGATVLDVFARILAERFVERFVAPLADALAAAVFPASGGLLGGFGTALAGALGGRAAAPAIRTTGAASSWGIVLPPSLVAAQGAVVEGGEAQPVGDGPPPLAAFSGGIVEAPTLFGLGSGRTGLMGEAGPEAILPLVRGAAGLGLRATGPRGEASVVPLARDAAGTLGIRLPGEPPDTETLARGAALAAQAGLPVSSPAGRRAKVFAKGGAPANPGAEHGAAPQRPLAPGREALGLRGPAEPRQASPTLGRDAMRHLGLGPVQDPPLPSGAEKGSAALAGSEAQPVGDGPPPLAAFSGGIVEAPTLFGLGSGRTGLMGEAGPEAILPLVRGAAGLGLRATGPRGEASVVPLARDAAGTLGIRLPGEPPAPETLARGAALAAQAGLASSATATIEPPARVVEAFPGLRAFAMGGVPAFRSGDPPVWRSAVMEAPVATLMPHLRQTVMDAPGLAGSDGGALLRAFEALAQSRPAAPPQVHVHNAPEGTRVETRPARGGGEQVDVLLPMIEAAVERDARRGGRMSRALAQAFGLRRVGS
jgi:hypothetical protein